MQTKQCGFSFTFMIFNNLLNCRRKKDGVYRKKAGRELTRFQYASVTFPFCFSLKATCYPIDWYGLHYSFVAQFCPPPINLKSTDLHPLYSHNLRRHDVQRETNLEQSAAAGPFPLCRTAHASFDPENYLKSTEGHIRWRRSDIEHI